MSKLVKSIYIRKFLAVFLLTIMVLQILPVSEFTNSDTGSIEVNADSNDRRRTWIQLSKGKKIISYLIHYL